MRGITNYQRNILAMTILMAAGDIILDALTIFYHIWVPIFPGTSYSLGSFALLAGISAIIIYAIFGEPVRR